MYLKKIKLSYIENKQMNNKMEVVPSHYQTLECLSCPVYIQGMINESSLCFPVHPNRSETKFTRFLQSPEKEVPSCTQLNLAGVSDPGFFRHTEPVLQSSGVLWAIHIWLTLSFPVSAASDDAPSLVSCHFMLHGALFLPVCPFLSHFNYSFLVVFSPPHDSPNLLL